VIVTTGNEVEGRPIAEYLGIVRGIVVRVPTRRQRIRGSFEATFEGGNVAEYVEVCEAAREDAYALLVEHATALGADAVVATRYQATPFSQSKGTSEVLVYGTAVRLGVTPQTPRSRTRP
jgi:uncharacterized protein YbjQ (UPF0145 family)